MTRWESMETITRFAGPDVANAVVETAAVAAVTEYNRQVVHHHVIAQT